MIDVSENVIENKQCGISPGAIGDVHADELVSPRTGY